MDTCYKGKLWIKYMNPDFSKDEMTVHSNHYNHRISVVQWAERIKNQIKDSGCAIVESKLTITVKE